ncbi:MAG: hypothetical protein EPO06_01245 [Burkholderiaceae bacterium]|nr:MAG: hypothetical protein EPO06_01245 [Burkholderiaceae bacterium]
MTTMTQAAETRRPDAHSPKAHSTNAPVPFTTLDQFEQLKQLFKPYKPAPQALKSDPPPEERIKILQQAITQEMAHHMDELLQFGQDCDPFFGAFIEYHRRRMHGLQQALNEAFPELNA